MTTRTRKRLWSHLEPENWENWDRADDDQSHSCERIPMVSHIMSIEALSILMTIFQYFQIASEFDINFATSRSVRPLHIVRPVTLCNCDCQNFFHDDTFRAVTILNHFHSSGSTIRHYHTDDGQCFWDRNFDSCLMHVHSFRFSHLIDGFSLRLSKCLSRLILSEIG